MISAGNQVYKIAIKQAIDASDSGGGGLTTYSTYWETNARIRALKSVKTVQANQDKLINGFTFSLRYRKDKQVSTDMFIDYRGNRYAIVSVENPGFKNDELLLTGMIREKPLAGVIAEGSEFTTEFTNPFGSGV